MKAVKNGGLYRLRVHQFEQCTRIPHIHCLAHPQFANEDNMSCFLISDNARSDPVSDIHYKWGHPSAIKTRHICKCYNLPGIRKMEVKAFDFLKNCEFCRQAKAKRHSFSGTMARPTVLGKIWYADVKGPFEKPSLVHENTYVFGIIEA